MIKTNVYFQYIDLWSSIYTWGGVSLPQAGDLVVIGPSQTIYLDTETAVLAGLIIQGGSLIFDDKQDVHLQAQYIVIVYKNSTFFKTITSLVNLFYVRKITFFVL
jgi:hypothetical protein